MSQKIPSAKMWIGLSPKEAERKIRLISNALDSSFDAAYGKNSHAILYKSADETIKFLNVLVPYFEIKCITGNEGNQSVIESLGCDARQVLQDLQLESLYRVSKNGYVSKDNKALGCLQSIAKECLQQVKDSWKERYTVEDGVKKHSAGKEHVQKQLRKSASSIEIILVDICTLCNYGSGQMNKLFGLFKKAYVAKQWNTAGK